MKDAGTEQILIQLDYCGVEDNYAINEVYECYLEPHRFYHNNWSHIKDLIRQLGDKDLYDNKALFLAAIYHDAVYNPKSQTNEEDSAAMFSKAFHGNDSLRNEVVQIILDTKTHEPQSELSRIFCEMDMDILNRPFGELLDYEDKIFKEFQFVDWKIYQANRVAFLKSVANEYDVAALIQYVENRKPRIAVYPGSFDPFHVGHFNILQKAEKEFDKAIVAKD